MATANKTRAGPNTEGVLPNDESYSHLKTLCTLAPPMKQDGTPKFEAVRDGAVLINCAAVWGHNHKGPTLTELGTLKAEPYPMKTTLAPKMTPKMKTKMTTKQANRCNFRPNPGVLTRTPKKARLLGFVEIAKKRATRSFLIKRRGLHEAEQVSIKSRHLGWRLHSFNLNGVRVTKFVRPADDWEGLQPKHALKEIKAKRARLEFLDARINELNEKLVDTDDVDHEYESLLRLLQLRIFPAGSKLRLEYERRELAADQRDRLAAMEDRSHALDTPTTNPVDAIIVTMNELYDGMDDDSLDVAASSGGTYPVEETAHLEEAPVEAPVEGPVEFVRGGKK